MQPLSLHVDGLHSFRRPVDIDLAELGQHGLFGIFGPIGSGKSTLLDAMTLALFGTVDRLVGRSKRGIVNHQAKRCEVRFRFRVGDTEWEAQRAYRADSEGVAQRIHSRLARMNGTTQEVVADKEREVNAAVESLLGLSAEDFMRAVVLPQGRFMEFLHLQGTDRRRMLQRIFRLEPFGEGLRARVKRESDAVAGRLHHATGELEGLGDAGSNTVEAARSAAEVARGAAIEARAAFAVAAEAAEEARKSVRHHRALAEARRALDTHDAEADRFQGLRERIATARRVRPVLDARMREQAARGAVAAARARVERAQASMDDAKSRSSRAAAERAEAVERRTSRSPALQQQREALVRAVRLLGELEEVASRTHKLAHRRGQLRRRQEDEERQAGDEERKLEKIVARRIELRNAWSETQVTPALRARMRTAESAKIALEQARKRSTSLAAEIVEQTERAREAAEAVRRAQAAVEAGEDRLDRSRREAALLEAQLDALGGVSQAADAVRRQGLLDRMGAAVELRRVAQAERDATREAVAQAEADVERLGGEALAPAKLAGLLAASLVEGDACLVCGSTDHPSPAKPTREHDLLEIVAARARAAASLEARQEALAGAEHRARVAAEGLDALIAAIPPVLGVSAADALLLLLEREEKARRTLQHAIARAERSRTAIAPGVEDARSLLATATARHGAILDELERLKAAQSETLDAEGRAWGELTDSLGELTMFDLPRVVADIADRDRRRQELEPRIDAVEAELTAAQKAWEQRRDSLSGRRAELERVKAEHDAADARRESLLAAVREAAPEGDPVERLAAVEAELASIERGVTEASAGLDAARLVAGQATAEHAAAEQAVQSATAHVDDAARAAAAARDAAGLPESAIVPEAGLPGEDLDALQSGVERWFERRAALAHGLQSLEAQHVAEVSAEHAESLEQELARAEAQRRAAEADLVRTSERLAQLEARAKRYADLTREHADLTERHERLGTLARLLRGDRFVEYVANDYLHDLAALATDHLGRLTRGRYALTLDDSGSFLIADLDAGGAVRPASSLSGGETFITSLALALALSTQVQRHNSNPLEFFFLDEGFGSLDPESLDRVMSAIESLSDGRRVIGLISHVGAVRERVPRYLSLSCPRDGSGTKVDLRES
ncbi:MAG: SMC family ATPase [Alphaproteobacteria bacterium]|nr:SMC family ATPase [Alphaproteobacteria bacterium]